MSNAQSSLLNSQPQSLFSYNLTIAEQLKSVISHVESTWGEIPCISFNQAIVVLQEYYRTDTKIELKEIITSNAATLSALFTRLRTLADPNAEFTKSDDAKIILALLERLRANEMQYEVLTDITPIIKFFSALLDDLAKEEKSGEFRIVKKDEAAKLTTAIRYALQIMVEDIHPILDCQVQDKHGKRFIPLVEILALVCLATLDDKPYQTQDQKQSSIDLKRDKEFRMLSLLNSLDGLAKHQRCHLGIWHDLLGVLNYVFPKIKIIEDINAKILYLAVDYFTSKLTALSKDEVTRILLAWSSGVATKELDDFFAGNKNELKILLLDQLPKNTTDDAAINKKVTAMLERLCDLPLPVVFPEVIWLQELFNVQLKSGYAYTEAFVKLRTKTQQCQTYHELQTLNLEKFHCMERLRDALATMQYIMYFPIGEASLAAKLHKFKNILLVYYKEILTEKCASDAKESKIDQQELEQFLKEAQLAKKQKSDDIVVSFFALWKNLLEINMDAELYGLWMRLLNTQLPELNNALLESIYEAIAVQIGTIDFPYGILNIIAIHAHLHSPKHWSKEFYKVFVRLLDLVVLQSGDTKESKSTINLTIAALNSYPAGFLAQLRFLKGLYELSHLTSDEKKESKGEMLENAIQPLIVIPCNLDGIKVIDCFLLKDH